MQRNLYPVSLLGIIGRRSISMTEFADRVMKTLSPPTSLVNTYHNNHYTTNVIGRLILLHEIFANFKMVGIGTLKNHNAESRHRKKPEGENMKISMLV
jgi:hypothetical protein